LVKATPPVEERPINTDADHEAALLEIERLWDAKAGTADGDRLDILMTGVEVYEEAHFPIPGGQPNKKHPTTSCPESNCPKQQGSSLPLGRTRE